MLSLGSERAFNGKVFFLLDPLVCVAAHAAVAVRNGQVKLT